MNKDLRQSVMVLSLRFATGGIRRTGVSLEGDCAGPPETGQAAQD
jgi:hypothetical protein